RRARSRARPHDTAGPPGHGPWTTTHTRAAIPATPLRDVGAAAATGARGVTHPAPDGGADAPVSAPPGAAGSLRGGNTSPRHPRLRRPVAASARTARCRCARVD